MQMQAELEDLQPTEQGKTFLSLLGALHQISVWSHCNDDSLPGFNFSFTYSKFMQAQAQVHVEVSDLKTDLVWAEFKIWPQKFSP